MLDSPPSPLPAFRARLREIRYSSKSVSAISELHAALREDPLAVAVRLFRDHGGANAAEYRELFADLSLPSWLMSQSGDTWKAEYQLALAHELILLCDWPTSPTDVLPPGETTAIVSGAAANVPQGLSILDLGCGTGVLALLLAPGSAQCVGTDLNPRAIALARHNAELNVLPEVEFRSGSLFQPVGDTRFDLIVSQPPYIPQPQETSRHVFLHGGTRGDELALELLHQLPDHLQPHGHALIFSDWSLCSGETLIDRIHVQGLHVTAYVAPPISPKSYAAAYGVELQEHLAAMKIAGVQQALLHLQPGRGFDLIPVLPHEWSGIRIAFS